MRKVSRLVAFVLLIPSARRKTQWNLYLTRRNEICTPLNRPDFSPNLSGKRGKAFRFTNAWEQRKAKDLFAAYSDKGHPDLDVLSATQDRGMVRRDDNNINISHDKKNEATYKRVLPGQFVIHLRSFQGGFAYSSIEGITSPAYTVFGFSKPQEHEPNFWKFVFSSEQFIKRLEKVTYGIRDGRSISYDEVLTLSFTFPGKNEQIQIAHFLDKVGALITLHQRQQNGGYLWLENSAKQVCFAIITASHYLSK